MYHMATFGKYQSKLLIVRENLVLLSKSFARDCIRMANYFL